MNPGLREPRAGAARCRTRSRSRSTGSRRGSTRSPRPRLPAPARTRPAHGPRLRPAEVTARRARRSRPSRRVRAGRQVEGLCAASSRAFAELVDRVGNVIDRDDVKRRLGHRRHRLEQPCGERPQRPVQDVESRRPAARPVTDDDARAAGSSTAGPCPGSGPAARPRTSTARRSCGSPGRRQGRPRRSARCACRRRTRSRPARSGPGRRSAGRAAANSSIRLVPSTLVARASSNGSCEGDRGGAVHDRADLFGERVARAGVEAELRLCQLAGNRLDAAREQLGAAPNSSRSTPSTPLARAVVGLRTHQAGDARDRCARGTAPALPSRRSRSRRSARRDRCVHPCPLQRAQRPGDAGAVCSWLDQLIDLAVGGRDLRAQVHARHSGSASSSRAASGSSPPPVRGGG